MRLPGKSLLGLAGAIAFGLWLVAVQPVRAQTPGDILAADDDKPRPKKMPPFSGSDKEELRRLERQLEELREQLRRELEFAKKKEKDKDKKKDKKKEGPSGTAQLEQRLREVERKLEGLAYEVRSIRTAVQQGEPRREVVPPPQPPRFAPPSPAPLMVAPPPFYPVPHYYDYLQSSYCPIFSPMSTFSPFSPMSTFSPFSPMSTFSPLSTYCR